ncbi:hypothetical protein [Actinomadura parmotrematis]|uniref:Uncharacterized protein n=1 Tax=Actinomadura parmotrematis TaxID=2864039 RepID=A0ABS7FNM1_9ACTN|nr:hypothetical protein [Actinomadura parmotrematis]MBW8481590.1 hypothetical protein [Actinomadura parmotrematis]
MSDANDGANGNEARIAEIDETLEYLRRQVPGPTDEPQDFGDAGQNLQEREELTTQIADLERERASLTGE